MRDYIKKYFTIDITKEGGSNRLAVVLRGMGCIAIFYCLIGAIYCAVAEHIPMVKFFLLFALAYAMLFHILGKVNVKVKLIMVSAVVMISVLIAFAFAGPKTIFQIYFFLLIVLSYFADYGHYVRKAVYSVIICVIYIAMSVVAIRMTPVLQFTQQDYVVIQIMNIICAFACIVVMCTVFSLDSQQLEGKIVEYNKILQKQAATDALTGLKNRRSAIEFIDKLVREGDERGFCVCMCDIDFFKKVNDSYGHDIGDNVLKGVAATMVEAVPEHCMISRWGGEEFLIIFAKMNGDEAKVILDTIRSRIKKIDFYAGQKKFNITVTYGLAEYGFDGDGTGLVKEADDKLYMGKENGRDQIVY